MQGRTIDWLFPVCAQAGDQTGNLDVCHDQESKRNAFVTGWGSNQPSHTGLGQAVLTFIKKCIGNMKRACSFIAHGSVIER